MSVQSPLPGNILKREPYYDDFDPAKKFAQILFKSNLAPQARELTQMQTILQEQIGRFAQGIYRNGSTVVGSKASISRANADGSIREITLTPGIAFFNNRFISVCNKNDTNGKYIINLENGIKNFGSTVRNLIDVSIAAASDTITLRDSTGFPATGVVRIDDEFISYGNKNGNVLTDLQRGFLNSVPAFHVASSACILTERRTGKKTDDTPYTFTYNGSKTSPYVENPSTDEGYNTWFNSNNFQVGFKVIENVVTASEDESLLDNSVGAPNFNSPGADRLFVDLELDFRPLGQEYSDFIFLIRYRDGNIIEEKVEPQYSEILNYFARTVQETQGNFSVSPHNTSVLEWSPREKEANPIRSDGYALNISSGKTYVDGFRREKLVPTKLNLDRGLSNISLNYSGNGLQFVAYDSFTVDLTISGPIQINKLIGITINVGGVQTYYAWIRQLEKTGDTTYRVYFSDASANFYSNFTNGVSVNFYNSESPATPGSAIAQGASTSAINFTDNKILVYNTMPDSVNFSDLTLYTKNYQSTSIPGGISTFSLNNNLTGETNPSDANSYTLSTTIPGNNVYVIDSSGNSYTTGFVLTNTGTNQISWTATPPTSNYHVYYEAYAFGSDTTSTERTDLRNTNVSASVTPPTSSKPTENVDQFIGGGTTPGYYDVFKINSVIDGNGIEYRNGVDYVLIDGQTPNYFYGSAIRWLKNRKRPTGTYTIDFNYWLHQGPSNTSANGSMITSDSFTISDGTSKDYQNISRYLGRRRSDFIDFRTRSNQVQIINDAYVVLDNSQNTIDSRKRSRRALNNNSFAYDVQRYLPRWDTLFVDKQGKFNLLGGTPRISPEKPKHPDNSLLLANIYIPAYSRSTGDVKIEPWESIRYRQEDLTRLERRITNLETFVLNNKLELLAMNQKLDDGDIARGIMVDDFSGHGVADVNNPEYTAAIDPVEGALRLPFTHEFFDINFDISNFDSVGSNILIGDKTVTLDFVEEPYIFNKKASTTFNVNPFDVFDWIGVMTLRPAVDIWVNTNLQPDIISDNNLNNSHFAKDNPVTGWDREFNFWFRTPLGLEKAQTDTNNRFQNGSPVSITDSQVKGGLNVADKADYVEDELRNSSRAWNSKLTGFQTDLV
jgi:hypothetical protein